MTRESSLVFYPGHLGPVGPAGPASELRTPGRAIRWDRSVKSVPEPDATDLVTLGGFHFALTYEDAAARYGLEVKRLKSLAKSQDVTTAEYQPPGEDAKPETVLVLDPTTRARLRQEMEPQKAADTPDAPADAGEES